MKNSMKRNARQIKSEAMPGYRLPTRKIYREAGRAVAIYMNNKQKKLPPVFFQIKIEQPCSHDKTVKNVYFANNGGMITVEGGRLLQSLPVSWTELADERHFLTAFEADIVNLLVGPITEARYTSLYDDEPFHMPLLNFNALKHYGGASDMEAANEYLDCLFKNETKRCIKADQLFTQAVRFIDNPSNWHAVEYLVGHILGARKNVITCEEIMAIVDEASARQEQPYNIAYALA